MVNGCCDRELERNGQRYGASGQRTLNKAIKRAERAQRRLREVISSYGAMAAEVVNATTSSSDSENENERASIEGRRNGGGGGLQICCSANNRGHSRLYHQGPWTGRHPPHGAHGQWAAMRGFPSGRHTMGFDGFGAFLGMMRPRLGPFAPTHPHPHHHHRHHPFSGYAGHAGLRRGGPGCRYGHEHGSKLGPFGRHFHHSGMGYATRNRQRAHSLPGV